MKIIFVVLTVAMIGLVAPNVFAENPITFQGIVDGYNHGVDVYINGHVNFENNKALGLGIGPGYQTTIQVFGSDGKLAFTESKKSVMPENISSFPYDISRFQFIIPSEELENSDRYSVYIFYGPPSNLKNTSFSGKIDIFVGIAPNEYQQKLNREQQLQSQTGTTFTTSPQDIESFIWIPVIIIIVIIVVAIARKSSQTRRSTITRYGISESDLMNNFAKLTWQDAEDLVGELFKEKGYEIQVGVLTESGEQKRSGDFGIDVRAKTSDESVGIQVKHWTANVTSEDVAKTIGYADPFDKIIIISTKSDFTAQTYTAKNDGQFKKAELWNSEKFKNELRKHVLR